jgi:hypothetical protein
MQLKHVELMKGQEVNISLDFRLGAEMPGRIEEIPAPFKSGPVFNPDPRYHPSNGRYLLSAFDFRGQELAKCLYTVEGASRRSCGYGQELRCGLERIPFVAQFAPRPVEYQKDGL